MHFLTSSYRRPSRLAFNIALAVLLVGSTGCRKQPSNQEQAGDVSQSSAEPSTSDVQAKPDATVTAELPSQNVKPPDESPEKEPSVPTREQSIDAALTAQDQGRFDKAIEILQQLILQDPKDYVAVFHLANAEAGKGNLLNAAEMLSEIPPTDPDSGLPALGVAADWYLELKRFDKAEQRYRQILQLAPQFNIARRRLAYLLNRQGRRYEANELIEQLCMAGDITQDELFALIVESDALYDAPDQSPSNGTRPYWPIGSLGEARHQFTTQNYEQAAVLLKPSIEDGSASQAAIAFYGLVLVEGQLDADFQKWLSFVSEPTKAFPEYWAAIGYHLVREAKFESAVGALAEALRLDPTDHRSVRRMIQSFRSLKNEAAEEAFKTRYKQLNRVIELGNQIATEETSKYQAMVELADQLAELGRPLEGILWKSLAFSSVPNQQSQLQQLGVALKQVTSSADAFPSLPTRWCGVDLSKFPKPSVDPSDIVNPQQGLASALPVDLTEADFRDVSIPLGIDHRYKVAASDQKKAFAIYQQLGGGVAALDYDLDGLVDLYLAQGAADAPDFVANESDKLLRHVIVRTHAMIDQTESAGLSERQYTIGVTSGDWNQDGFPDLAISNIGINQLMINRGDGTFAVKDLDSEPKLTRCVSSLAMGDVTGDHLPDIVSLNYIDDPAIARRPKLDLQGNVTASIAPLEFKPQLDDLYRNSATGEHAATVIGTSQEDACTGLGIVIADLLGDRRNEILVGNDALQNQLWKANDKNEFADVAVATGCAYGAHSLATAAMGIAVADFDRSGSPDFHITNFSKEPNSLYLQDDGMYRDLSIRFKLETESIPMVGFGTQPIDYNNDGWCDLAIANGHVDDLAHAGEPFKQLPQLFANRGDKFQSLEPATDNYWKLPHLGRAMAMLDFDTDGRQDYVVTDLQDRCSLILNQTNAGSNWMQLALVGTESERDAIGARVTVKGEGHTWHSQVTAGDGYLCKNEALVSIGLGKVASVEEVIIEWPSGRQQTFSGLPINRRSILIEGLGHDSFSKE
ncbi:FG-GAP-like repeat-containing protein [Stieleria sp. JC731]|uniref:FG-GAP-like repeat-containing protein n=1 Tax=Pirellulaceae TaxID=2691357 RepID=UPI001E5F6462|nr:FG-GAP-like repeat-containing protein [Stieleria sp. JC731]MCC9604139.1 FG-GAP-like repeat-containing protein [Stieleria sp. JC731]